MDHPHFPSSSHHPQASTSRGHAPTSSAHHPPTNTHLSRLAIPYSASLPSLRKQALSPGPRKDDEPMTGSLAVASPARGASPADLQNHLYQSFLSRKTADVALRIRGSWHAIYRLHRVVLIQAVRELYSAYILSGIDLLRCLGVLSVPLHVRLLREQVQTLGEAYRGGRH